jgi:hypothetical protein
MITLQRVNYYTKHKKAEWFCLSKIPSGFHKKNKNKYEEKN